MEPLSALSIHIAPDRKVATLTIDPQAAPAGVPAARVAAALQRSGIHATPEFLGRLAALEQTGENLRPGAAIVIARATPPTDPAPARLEPIASADAADAPEHERCKLPVARPGQPLARVIPSRPGAEGRDVLGGALPYKPAPGGYELKRGVRLSEDGRHVEATVAGLFCVTETSAEVEPGLNIAGDVDLTTGSVSFEGDLSIGGNVLDRFRVAASGSITVGGSVQAATVHAGKDLVVSRGIVCREQGQCRAGGSVRARHATNARVFAGGDIEVHGEAANCRLACRGRLLCGTLSGGQASALAGAVIGTLGSPAHVRTILEVGFDAERLEAARAARAEAARLGGEAAALRAQAAPLVQHQRNLTAQQKELVTELLFRAQELEEAAAACLARAGDEAENAAATAEFTGLLHAGVIARWADTEAAVAADIRGPGVIRRIDSKQGPSVIVADPGGRETHLPTRAVPAQGKASASVHGAAA